MEFSGKGKGKAKNKHEFNIWQDNSKNFYGTICWFEGKWNLEVTAEKALYSIEALEQIVAFIKGLEK